MRRTILVGFGLLVLILIPITLAQDTPSNIFVDSFGVASLVISLLVLLVGVLVLVITLLGYIRLGKQMEQHTRQTEQLQKLVDDLSLQFRTHSDSSEVHHLSELQTSLDQIKTQNAEIDTRIAQQRHETSDTILAMTLLPLGERQYRTRDLSGAIETYKRALSLNDTSPVIHYRIGYIYGQRGELDTAEQSLQRALEIDAAFSPALAALGYIYRRKGDLLLSASEGETYLLKAEGKLLEALQNSPKLLDEEGESWWCALGALYRQRGQIKKAIDAYKEAAAITPYSPYPLSNLALYQGMNGNVDAMLQTYREVEHLARQKTQANPDDYWPYTDLLIARLALGKIQSAEDTLKLLLKVVPRDLAYAVPGLLVTLSRLSKILPDSAKHIDEVVRYIREHVVEGKGLDGDISLSNETFVIPFDGVPALGVQVSNHDDPTKVIEMLDLAEPRPAIFILGGAMDMASEEMQAIRLIIEEGLARYAQEHRVAIVDGGTHSGVMRLMGEARRKNAATFPLIGVAPINLVKYKGYDNPSGYDLDPGHSHFVLTSEGDWGDETDMIMQLAHALTGMGQCPGLGLVINGGNIVRQEVYRLTVSERMRFPMLVLEGSGRFADMLAQAIRTGDCGDDEELEAIAATGKIEVLSISAGTQGMQSRLRHYLTKTPTSVDESSNL